MLHIRYANRTESLAAHLAESLAMPSNTPLSPDWVVVPHSEMARWLRWFFATRHGICAGLKVMLPHAALWQLMATLRPEIGSENRFSPSVLGLRIHALMETSPEHFPSALQQRLGAGDERAAMAFARRLAKLFDQYMQFRPDWIEQWEGGGEDHWQARLWRLINPQGQAHWASSLAWLAQLHERPPQSQLPARLSAVLPPHLSRTYIGALSRLAEWMDVFLYQWVPSAEYWADLPSPRAVRSHAGVDQGNRLLASMGGELRDHLDGLQELAAVVAEDYREIDGQGHLQRMQQAVLHCRGPMGAVTDAKDDSIQIHCCHGRRREVEACRDRLLDLFDRDSSLTPDQVLITAPDISRYHAYIRAAFGSPNDGVMPYRLLLSAGQDEHVMNIFSLLRALDEPLNQRSALDLLTLSSVRQAFRLSMADVDLIAQWIQQSGLYDVETGRDEPSKFSWHQAAQRLLLSSLSAPGAGIESLHQVRVNGSEFELLGSFLAYLNELVEYQRQAQQRQPMVAWQAWLQRLLHRLLSADQTAVAIQMGLTHAMAQLVLEAEQAEAGQFSLTLMLDLLHDELSRHQQSGSPGPPAGVTIASAQSVRMLPYQVIYVLGLNDGEFPANETILDMDLIAAHPRLGDRSRRADDRLLFLEWLCCARQRLILSYVGYDARDHTARNPAPVIAELQAELAPAEVTQYHPAQPFSPRYGRETGLYTYAKELAPLPQSVKADGVFIDQALSMAPSPLVEVADLLDFYRNPARFFLTRQLNIRLQDATATGSSEDPPATLDGLSAYKLRDWLTERHLQGNDPSRLADLAGTAWAMPDTPIGVATGLDLADEAVSYGQDLEAWQPRTHWREVDVDFGFVRLRGRIGGLSATDHVVFRPVHHSPKLVLNTWLQHLILNCVGPTVSYLLDRAGQHRMAPVAEARPILAAMLRWFQQGQNSPLPFFPATSQKFALQNDRAKGLHAARQLFLPDRPAFGPDVEGQDPYVRLAFRGQQCLDRQFERCAQEVWGPALALGVK